MVLTHADKASDAHDVGFHAVNRIEGDVHDGADVLIGVIVDIPNRLLRTQLIPGRDARERPANAILRTPAICLGFRNDRH